ncbi:MAG: acetyltransferase [Chlorobiaceae bacterium]|nr:acetyltransferase [Chlorobiaceae bacterium]
MKNVVIYGVGSPVLADIEETLFRVGALISAGVQNYAGRSYLSEGIPLVTPDNLDAEITDLPFIVPLFTPGNRHQAALEARQKGFFLPFTLVDPTSITPRSLTIEPGGYINAGCSLGAQSTFGSFVFVNRGATIGHHAKIGHFVSIGPGAVIAGSVTIGTGAMIGSGSVLLPEVSIGENSVVGAGSVVTRDVPAHCLVLGNPARIVKENIAGYKDINVSVPTQ